MNNPIGLETIAIVVLVTIAVVGFVTTAVVGLVTNNIPPFRNFTSDSDTKIFLYPQFMQGKDGK